MLKQILTFFAFFLIFCHNPKSNIAPIWDKTNETHPFGVRLGLVMTGIFRN